MIAVDTNIVVRLLTRDDESQYNRSRQLFQEQEILIPDSVILETEWVLRFSYRLRPSEVCEAFKNLMGLSNVHLVDKEGMVIVLQWHESGLDFADAFHLAKSQRCSAIYTFDVEFVNKATGLTACEVRQP
ncbi:MAG: type II toxin-antitoxin system VapC family toxin [Oculatellaceae cyanobacterium Prado106]|jgi:predicted nucleic-acid-binding protein|nr:type II toxin-antitoxin system VapC family toxin [Oculatellaceae cyanobacterium Prado106]